MAPIFRFYHKLAWTAMPQPKGPRPSGLVFVFHGLGDTADGWVDTAQLLQKRRPDLHFLLPTAPNQSVSMNMGASMPAWFDIKGRTNPHDTAGLIRSALGEYPTGICRPWVEIVEQMQTACEAHSVHPRNVILMGFSQGAHLAAWVALHLPFRVGGVVLLSGMVFGPDFVRVANKAAIAETPFFFGHGSGDQLIPIIASRMTRQNLVTKWGAQEHNLEAHEYPIEHNVSMPELNDVGSFISRVLPDGEKGGKEADEAVGGDTCVDWGQAQALAGNAPLLLPGCTAVTFGLKTAALNGSVVTIKGYRPDRQRYVVADAAGGDDIAVSRKNLCLLSSTAEAHAVVDFERRTYRVHQADEAVYVGAPVDGDASERVRIPRTQAVLPPATPVVITGLTGDHEANNGLEGRVLGAEGEKVLVHCRSKILKVRRECAQL